MFFMNIGDSEMNKKVKCTDCMHERGIGFDAWCNLGLKHHLNDLHTCEAFYSSEKYDDNINNTFTDFEFKNGVITLWKRHPIGNKDIGYKFTKQEFLTFLNSNYR